MKKTWRTSTSGGPSVSGIPQEKGTLPGEDRACMDGIREYFETVQQKAELAGEA